MVPLVDQVEGATSSLGEVAEGVGIGAPTAKPLILQGFGRLNLLRV